MGPDECDVPHRNGAGTAARMSMAKKMTSSTSFGRGVELRARKMRRWRGRRGKQRWRRERTVRVPGPGKARAEGQGSAGESDQMATGGTNAPANVRRAREGKGAISIRRGKLFSAEATSGIPLQVLPQLWSFQCSGCR